MEKFILVFLLLVSSALPEEIYENSTNICERCICSDAGDFILDCSKQNMQHILANWPPHNKTIVASFSYNNMTTLEVLPPTEQIARMVFDHCNIKYLDPGTFASMRNVEYIDLSYNLLTTEEIDGEDFKGPYNNSVYYPIAVKYLNLAYNQIHSLPRKFFENMPDLEKLNLEGNDFHVLDQNTQMAFSSLVKLKVLNLAHNELTELVGDAVKNMKSLVEINLESNLLDFVPETLDYLGTHLQILRLSDNYIFEFRDTSFLGLTGIRELYLDNLPRLRVIYVDTFANLPNLKKLSLRDNSNLAVIDREAFGLNQSLEELYLTNNSLTQLEYKLLKWSSLKIFKLKDSDLRCDCDLYNISKDLSKDITRDLDGPICFDSTMEKSRLMYNLTEDICERPPAGPFAIQHAIRHFEAMRITVISLSIIFSVGTFAALTIAFLRYRKGAAYRNYNFTSQVQYNPIRNQFRI